MEYVKIPGDRIGVLVGTKGETKKDIQDKVGITLTVDKDGTVTIERTGDDPLAEWKGRDIVRAIARGVNPEKAMLLCKENYMLEIIDLRDLVSGDKALRRQKARIIGRSGKTRTHIEDLTTCYISIYGKSVAIIGELEEIQVAKKAVVMLAIGKPHSTVYRFLQDKAREFKERRILQLWKKPGEGYEDYPRPF